MRVFRIIASAAIVLLMCSCSSDITTEIKKQDYETDYSTATIEKLLIKYPPDEAFATTLNQQTENSLSERLSGFEKDAKDSIDIRPEGSKAEFVTKQLVKYNKDNFLSVVEEEYSYISGAHGMTVWNAKNINFNTKKQICLEDLFADIGYETVLNNMIDALVEQNPDKYADLWKKPSIQEEHQYNFYITDTDLVIYFMPYELSYYARGFVEFPLRLSDLKGYLKEEYYFLAGSDTKLGEDAVASSPSFI